MTGIERRLTTNAYWARRARGLVARAATQIEQCANLSVRLSGPDAEEVRQAVAEVGRPTRATGRSWSCPLRAARRLSTSAKSTGATARQAARRRQAAQARTGSRSGSSSSPFSRTRTAPSGSSSRPAGPAISSFARSPASPTTMGWSLRHPHRLADRDRLFDHPADGLRLPAADPDAAALSPGSARSSSSRSPPAAFSAIETWSVATFVDPGIAAGGAAASSARSCSPSRCSSPGRRSITAINFFILLEEQSDRLLRLESQASQRPARHAALPAQSRTSCSTR